MDKLLGGGEEVHEVSGGPSGMGIDRIGERLLPSLVKDRLLGCMRQILQWARVAGG